MSCGSNQLSQQEKIADSIVGIVNCTTVRKPGCSRSCDSDQCMLVIPNMVETVGQYLDDLQYWVRYR